MKRFVRGVTCVALAGGFSLLVGLNPAQAGQPWNLDNLGGYSSCKERAQQVILEAAYQTQTGGIIKESFMKGIIGSVYYIASHLQQYDLNNANTTDLADAKLGAIELLEKMTAAKENATTKSRYPQMTGAAATLILEGRGAKDFTDSGIDVNYLYQRQPITVTGDLLNHTGVQGFEACVDGIVVP